MTQTGYTNAIVDAMLGWLKGLASWVLKLFNLSVGFSPLRFLANNWLKLLIVLLVIGVTVDLLVWLIRWRPHWVWFHKKRVIINDSNFFVREKFMDSADEWDGQKRPSRPKRNWEENDFVVPGAQRRRREAREQEERQRRRARAARVKSMQLGDAVQGESKDVFTDGMFNVNAKQKFSDKYEDEVFSVSDLPVSEAIEERMERSPERACAAQATRRPAQGDARMPRDARRPAQDASRAQRDGRRPRDEGRPAQGRDRARQGGKRPAMARGEKRPAPKGSGTARKKR